MSPVLSVQGLVVAYDAAPVLHNVSFDVERGKLVAIVGPNGAGKSTLIKALLGLIAVASGRVTFFGGSLRRHRRDIAYVPQRNAVDWDFPVNVAETVLFGTYPRLGWVRRPGRAERAWAEQCLARVGMTAYAGRQIGALSGGQQQRMFIARALAQKPRLLLLDEPFAGVDADSEAVIVDILRAAREEGRSALIVHHDIGKIREYFDDVLLLNKTVFGYGPVDQVLDDSSIAAAFTAQPLGYQPARGGD